MVCGPVPLLRSEDAFEPLRRDALLLQEGLGPTRDIPAPDVNTNPQVMAWIMDQYSKYHGHSPAVVTGKPLELYGSRGRDSATGRGLLQIAREILKDVGSEVKRNRFAI